MGSTRLPGKVLAPLNGRPMLRFMLDRLASRPVGQVVVATSELDRDDPIAREAHNAGIPVVRGAEQDVLARFVRALENHPADAVVRLTADCPLVDPSIVVAVAEEHSRYAADYTTNVLPRTFPKGLDVEVISASALRDAHDRAVDPAEREHVTPYLYRHPEVFRLANYRSAVDYSGRRWTVDIAEDLELMQSVAEQIGQRIDTPWHQLIAITPAPARLEGLYLRTAMQDDSDLVLRLRNDPDAVRTSASGRSVDPAEHSRWWSERLRDPGARLWIAEQDDRPVGFVRMQVASAIGQVSIAVDRDHRGQGHATAILQLMHEELANDFQVVALEALIRKTNHASLRAFERAAYARQRDDDDFHVLRRDRRS
jgi:spore coat polysaccharide biosynthesis protein SpsF